MLSNKLRERILVGYKPNSGCELANDYLVPGVEKKLKRRPSRVRSHGFEIREVTVPGEVAFPTASGSVAALAAES